MRIIALVSNEVTYEPKVYEPLVSALKSDFVGIIIVPFQTRVKTKFSLLSFFYKLYGLRGFLIKVFQVMKANMLDIINRRINNYNRCYSLRGVAEKYKIPIYYIANINSSKSLNLIENLKPDIIISSQGHFIGKRLLGIPRIGIINKHAGLLPKYRGVYPVFWAMLNNENKIGVTIHFMNENLDDGDILLQQTIPIKNDDTFESLYCKVVEITPKLFIKVVEFLKKGDYDTIPNEKDKATCFHYPSKEEIKKFKKKGLRII